MNYSKLTEKVPHINIGRMAVYNEHAQKLLTAEALLGFRTMFGSESVKDMIQITKLQNDVLQHTINLVESCTNDEFMKRILIVDTTLTGDC